MTYEGWANYHTWNVSLWIANDQLLYNLGRKYAQTKGDRATYEEYVSKVIPREYCCLTGDSVSWTDPTLDHEALDQFIRELGE